jgi:hypothetical protein
VRVNIDLLTDRCYLKSSDKLAGLVLLEALLILLYSHLNTEIQAIATAEGATSLEIATGLIMPYILLVIIIVLAGAIVYEATR